MKTIKSTVNSLNRISSSWLLVVLFLPFTSHSVWANRQPITQMSITGNTQIPVNIPNYETDVETWWATHPFNPESSTYIPIGSISSPNPVINVKQQFQGNIQSAIDALPLTGGTLYFEPGSYTNTFKLVGKSNVHFISPGGAILTGGPGWVVGCQTALNYSDIAYEVFNHDPASIACVTTNRIQNIYFKNITFDGGGSALNAIELSAANGVVFDNVIFQNFFDPGNSHSGMVDGNVNIDNIWFRGTHFAGRERWALYLDGAHFSGVVESQIDFNFGIGGLLFMTNDDLNADYNQNGIMDPDEKRIANYIVVANNEFGAEGEPFMYTGVAFAGSNILVQKNTVLRGMYRFALFNGKCDAVNPGVDLRFYYLKVIGNTMADASTIAQVDGKKETCEVYDNTMGVGKYTVWGNYVEAPNLLVPVQETNLPLEAPNVEGNNCVDGKLIYTDTPCTGPSTEPEPQPQPEPQPEPQPQPQPQPSPRFKLFIPSLLIEASP